MAKKKATTRRGNNEGTICQRKDGTYTAAVSMGCDDNGKPRRKYFYGKTRSEVAIKMTTTLTTNLKGIKTSVQNDDFQTLMREWLFTFKKATVTPRTFEKSLNKADKYIFPQIGCLKLSEIKTPVVQRLLNNLVLEEYALDTVKKTKFLISQFFEYAVDSEFADKNPVKKVKLQSKERKTMSEEESNYKPIPEEIRATFLKVLGKSEVLKPICLTCLFARLRIGEVLALKWSDVNFENKVISVSKAITQIPQFDKAGKVTSRKTVISNTKTAASEREVPMPNVLMNALDEWRSIRTCRKAKHKLVFSSKTT